MWFLATSMVYSRHKLQVYCNPSRTGFATFYQFYTDNQSSKLDESQQQNQRLATQFVPFKGFPSSTADDVSPRVVAFMPFTAPVSLFDT